MSPRNNLFFFISLVMALTIYMGISTAAAWGDSPKTDTGNHPIIQLYEKYISPVDGERCPMYPTCSAYARQAIQQHGLFIGWIMACDRLVRCGRDETRISPEIIKENVRATLDPVSANDFWWYRKP